MALNKVLSVVLYYYPDESIWSTHNKVITYVCMYVCMYVWMYVWMDVCMYVWMDGWMDFATTICALLTVM